MPRRPPPNVFDLVDEFLDNLADQARIYIRNGIQNAGIPTQLPGQAPVPEPGASTPRPRQRPQPRATSQNRPRPARPAKTGPNHYDTLEVVPNASQEAITGAYKALARKYHPDVNRTSSAADKIRAITVAYGVLRDPVKRREYDKELRKR